MQPVRTFGRRHLDFYAGVRDGLQVRFLDTFVYSVLLGADLRDGGLASDTQNGIVIYSDGLASDTQNGKVIYSDGLFEVIH